MGRRSKRNRLRLFFGVGAVAIVVALGAYAGHLLQSIELSSVDTRFAIRGSQGPPKEVVLVSIDEKTHNWFVKHNHQFPYPRRYHAVVINQLAKAKAKAIGIDLEFVEQTDPRNDGPLVNAVYQAGNKIVLAATEVDD